MHRVNTIREPKVKEREKSKSKVEEAETIKFNFSFRIVHQREKAVLVECGKELRTDKITMVDDFSYFFFTFSFGS